jgi:cytochrome c oxidase subunit 1
MASDTGSSSESYLSYRYGAGSWLFTSDHKRIAILYLITISVFFLFAVVNAMVLRVEALSSEGTLLQPETFGRVFTLHGLFAVFFFLLPALSSVLGNFLVPIALGASNLAFPRLNLLGWYLFAAGGLLLTWSAIHGGVDTGWSLATPASALSSKSEVAEPAIAALLSVLSSALMGANIIATVHRSGGFSAQRARVRVFVTTQYTAAIMTVLATPFFVSAILVLLRSPTLVRGPHIDPSEALLYRKLFWMYVLPALHAPLVCAVGIITEILTTFTGNVSRRERFLVCCVLSIAVFGALSWGPHLFPGDLSPYLLAVSSLCALVVVVPCVAIVMHWLAMLYRGPVRWTSPMLYSLVFAALFTIGGVSGTPLALPPLSVQLHGTSYETAYFHLFVAGGVITSFIAGLHFWWPKITGRHYPEAVARFVAVVIFIGFNLTFLPRYFLGYFGEPTREYSYPAEFQALEVLSSAGMTILFVGLAIPALYFTWSFFWGRAAEANPWNSKGLEWDMPSPPYPAPLASWEPALDKNA